MWMISPVMVAGPSIRKSAAWQTSSSVTQREMGACASTFSAGPPSAGGNTAPNASPLTLIRGASATASERVRAASAALETV
jgi:hypothetical protein